VVCRPLVRGEQRRVNQVRKRARHRRRVQLPHKDTDLAAELGLAISDEIHITLGRADIRQAIGRMKNPTLTRLVPGSSNLEERVRFGSWGLVREMDCLHACPKLKQLGSIE
jgi:hypothetical protein